jgi:predicted permease
MPSWESLKHDFVFAFRMLRKSPGFSLGAVLTLALGIGANTAMFSIVNAWLLRPLPLEAPQQLITVWRSSQQNPGQPAYFDYYRDYLVWSAENRSFKSLAATFEQRYALTGVGDPQQLHGAVASSNFFATLGVQPSLGRLFLPNDVAGEPACVMSHALWAKQFHSSPSIVGQSIALNGQLYRVLGVLPPEFSFRVLDRPFETDVWTVINAGDPNYNSESTAAVAVIGRLKNGVTIAQASGDLSGLQTDLDRRFRDEPQHAGVLVVNLQQDNTRQFRSSLLIVFAAVMVLLVIACVNTGSLILGRNSERAREFAIRVALGCRTSRLLQQLTAEILVLFLLGGIAGLAIAFALVRIFVAWSPFGVLPPGGISLDGTVLGATAAAVCITAVVFGSIPAWRALKVREQDALRSAGANSTAAVPQLRARFVLVAAEVSLSVVLLIGAGLLISTFIKIGSEPLGFQVQDTFVADVALPYSSYKSGPDQFRFVRQLLQRLQATPAIDAAGIATTWPFNVNGLTPIETANDRGVTLDALPHAAQFEVSDGYFHALGIPLLRGRTFDEHDNSEAAPVAVISDEMARLYFAGQDAIGQRIRIRHLDESDGGSRWMTIVGVVATTRSLRYNQIQWDRYPAIYTCFFQRRDTSTVHNFSAQGIYMYLQARRGITPTVVANAVHSIDPNLPVGSLRSTGEIVSSLRAQPRVRADLLGGFGLLTLALAAIGVGGVMGQMVAQRRRDIGIRMALGAAKGDVLGLILRRALLLVCFGMVAGIAGAVAVAELLRGFLYGVSVLDPSVFGAVILVLTLVALAAAHVPALRAAKVDPMVTLRSE